MSAVSFRPFVLDPRCDVSGFSAKDYQEYSKIDAFVYSLNHLLKNKREVLSSQTSERCKNAMKIVKIKLLAKYGHENALDLIAAAISANLIFTHKLMRSLIPLEYSLIPEIPTISTHDMCVVGCKMPIPLHVLQEKATNSVIQSAFRVEKEVYELFVIKYPDGRSQWIYSGLRYFGNQAAPIDSGYSVSYTLDQREGGPIFWAGHILYSEYVKCQVNLRALKEWKAMNSAVKALLPECLPRFSLDLVGMVSEYYQPGFKPYERKKYIENLFKLAQEALGPDLKNPFGEPRECELLSTNFN